MTEEEVKIFNEKIKKCNCICHQPGVEIMHMFDCCSMTYQKPVKEEEEE